MKLIFILTIIAATLLPLQTAVSQSTFTRIATGPIATEGKYSNRGSWVDYDNDGDLDLFVANGGWYAGKGAAKANYLYRNDGSGVFTKITSGPLVEDVDQSLNGVWGDYNNDGRLDLFVTNVGEGDLSRASEWRNSVYQNQGDGTFLKVTNTPLDKDGGAHAAGLWADYDNDGHLDLLVANFKSPHLLYHNNGDGTFTRITEGTLQSNVTPAQDAVWVDYDNDGDLDLFMPNKGAEPLTAERNALYRNEGHGTFTRITTGQPVLEAAYHMSGAWGDYDNDGDLDLYVAVLMDTRNYRFQNNGDGTFLKITGGAETSEIGAFSAAWGDYDNDGFLDLFLARGSLGNRLYHNNGNGTFTRIASGPGSGTGATSLGCDWGDYDNDGFLDLFVANGTVFEGQPQMNNFLYHNNGNTFRWLKVRPVGTSSNRAGIGAKVRVQASLGGARQWELREISVGSGYSGHNLLAHFGLRDAQKADIVRIQWPSGIVQELRDVPANQTLTVSEPARLMVVGPGQFRIGCWRGQSFAVEASSDLTTWHGFATVTNLTGALEFVDPGASRSAQKFYRVIGR